MNKAIKFVLVIGIIGGIGTGAFYAVKNREANAQIVTDDTKQVGILVLKKEKISTISEFIGTLVPKEEVTVSFELGGTLLSLNKKEGDSVSVGEVLGQLDGRDYREKLEQADASIRQANAGYAQVLNGARSQEIEQAKLSLEKAERAYNKQLEDFKKIQVDYQDLKISKTEYDNAKYGIDLLSKDVEVARNAYSIATEGARKEVKDQTRAGLDLAISSKNQIQLMLDKTSLKSPISGTIINKLATAGQLVGARTPVFKIGNIDEFKVTIPVSDYDISNRRIGDKVNVELYGKIKIGEVNNILPSTNQGTGTIGVELRVDNKDHDWISGQIVKCSHEKIGEEGLYLPVSAVINRGDKESYVFLNKNNIAIKTAVSTGVVINNKIQIKSGLIEGDIVISKWADRLIGNEKIMEVKGEK